MDKTIVVFRRWRKSQVASQSVIALFPEIEHRWPLCSSYEHVGQHGGADYTGVISVTKPCLRWDKDVAELHRELTGLGYHLVVRQRYNHRRK